MSRIRRRSSTSRWRRPRCASPAPRVHSPLTRSAAGAEAQAVLLHRHDGGADHRLPATHPATPNPPPAPATPPRGARVRRRSASAGLRTRARARSRRGPAPAAANTPGSGALDGVRPRLGDRLGAGVAHQQLRPHRPARSRSSAGKRPMAVRVASSAITVVSPPSGTGVEAMTVSEPPSAMLRAAASARRATAGETYSSESMITTASAPRAATRRACSTACSTAWPCASAEAAKVTAAAGTAGPLCHSGTSSGRTPESTTVSSTPPLLGQRRGDAAQRLALAGARGADDGDARALAERREPLDRLDGRVVAAELEPLGREGDGQVVEAGALGDLVGGLAVDGVDADERREALGAPRRAHRAGDLVAGDELAALDLGGGDVDVLVGGLALGQADEGGAVAEQLDRALDLLVLDSASACLLLGRRGRDGLRACRLVAATAAAAGRRGSAVVAAVLVRRPRPRLRASGLRPPRRPRAAAALGRVLVHVVAAAAAASLPPSGGRARSSPACLVRMASIRSSLRRRRKPSTPSSLASRWRSASGDSASAERSSTEDMSHSLRYGSVGTRPRWDSGQQPGA